MALSHDLATNNPLSINHTQRRILELDGIRGIAILMVLLWHYIACVPYETGNNIILKLITAPIAGFWSGVDLFFVLSGFLIGGIILDHHQKKSFLKVFWIRRSCRILPPLLLLYASCLALFHLLDHNRFGWLFNDLMPWWSYLVFLHTNFMAAENSFGGHYLGVTWSLAVEEQFYFFAPLLMFLLGKRKWLGLMIPCIFIALLIQILTYTDSNFGTFRSSNTLARMDALVAGILLASLYRNRLIWEKLLAHKHSILIAFSVATAITGIIIYYHRYGFIKFMWFTIYYSMMILLTLLYSNSLITFILRLQPLMFLGRISLMFYLFHQAINGLCHGYLLNDSPNLLTSDAVWVTILALVLTIGLSAFSLFTYERFFMRIGHKYKYA